MFRSTIIAVSLLLTSALSAQNYYFVKHNNGNPAHANTGSVLNNQQDDADANSGGWNVLLSSNDTAKYSNKISVPFAFNFAGNPVSKFKVANTGYLTFDTNAAAPLQGTVLLPSLNLPPKTIYVGGVNANGDNDLVLSRTFGTTPNRQFWIKFQSYSTVGDTSGTYNYFSIVLEESTNKIHLVLMHQGQVFNAAVLPKLNPGIQLNISTAVTVENSLSKVYSWGSGKQPGDNEYYEFIYGTQPNRDLELRVMSAPSAVVKSQSLNVQYQLRNLGSFKTDSTEVFFQINNGTVFSEKKTTPTQLLPSGTSSFNQIYTTNVAAVAGGVYQLKMWITSANGIIETNKSNDTATIFYIVSNGISAPKKVLIETATATWCGDCPVADRTLHAVKTLLKDTLILVKHHSLDAMAGNGDSLNSEFLNGFPSSMLDRGSLGGSKSMVPDSVFVKLALARKVQAPASVKVSNVSLNTTTREFKFKVTAYFVDYYYGFLNLGGMAVEDNVRGVGAGFSQNIDRKYTADINHWYYNFSSPIVGYYHNDVSWNLPGSIWGQSLSTTAQTYKPGDSVSREFVYKYPSLLQTVGIAQSPYLPVGTVYSYGKPADMKAVGFLAATENGNAFVMNSAEAALWNIFLGTKRVSNTESLHVYPNPTTGIVQLEIPNNRVELRVISMAGTVQYMKSIEENTDKMVTLDLTALGLKNGVYLLQLNSILGTEVARIVLNR